MQAEAASCVSRLRSLMMHCEIKPACKAHIKSRSCKFGSADTVQHMAVAKTVSSRALCCDVERAQSGAA